MSKPNSIDRGIHSILKASSQISVDGSTSVLHEMENMSFCLDYILKSQKPEDGIGTKT